jgi:SOS-response transcriptional repressor LexA
MRKNSTSINQGKQIIDKYLSFNQQINKKYTNALEQRGYVDCNSSMEHVGNKIRHLRKRANITQAKLAHLAGVSTGTIRNAEDSAEKQGTTITWDAITGALAKKLKMPITEVDEYLVGKLTGPPSILGELDRRAREIGARPPPERVVESLPDIPVYSSPVPAGPKSEKAGAAVRVGFVPRALFPWDAQAYCVEVKGDSMVDWISEGDLVMVSPGVAHQIGFGDGAVCLVIDKTAGPGEWSDCIKRVFRWMDEQLRLESYNTAHQPRIIRRADVEVLPVVVRIRRDYLKMGLDLGAIENRKMPQDRRPRGEAQPFPDHENPNEKHPE